MSDIFKFPRTKHLFDAGGNAVSRDDLLMDPGEEAAFYSNTKPQGKGASPAKAAKASPKRKGGGGGEAAGKLVAIEEKVDGANLGITLSVRDLCLKVQNRSHFIDSSTHRQFSQLDYWLAEHSKGLFNLMGDEPGRYVLFGEWVLATHSIEYTRLPDYFLAFDIYDHHEQRFFSWRERNKRLQGTGIETVRLIAEEPLRGRDDARKLLDTPSAYYDGPVEGIFLRMDDDMVPATSPLGSEDTPLIYNINRGKLVRPDFLQGMEEQWTKKQFKKNKMKWV